jgi:hypothetical protein
LLGSGEMAHPASLVASTLATQIGYEILLGSPNITGLNKPGQLVFNKIHAGIKVTCQYLHRSNPHARLVM